VGKLTATAVKAAKEPGRYGDGDGLFLLVGKTGSKSWMVRVQKDGKRRDIGLGSAAKVSLALARERAAKVRSQVEAGIDPVADRRKAAGVPTFRKAAELVHAEHVKGWKGGKDSKHGAQWLATLEAYAFPAFGEAAVSAVDAPAVRDALAAIWLDKPETARRLRQRICTVIDWAVANGYRDASLPMPVIDKALPRQRVKPKHHAALSHADAPRFMTDLRAKETIGRLALEALILTAVRSGDLRGMKWAEVDIEEKLWRVPVEVGRGKGGRVHIVPLTSEAIYVLERARKHKRGDTDLVFPGAVKGKQLSDNTLRKVAVDMGYPITAHGFRSTFADWVNEQTSFPREVREAALAHVNQNKAEVAYSRTDYLEKRRPMMEAWAGYCLGASGGNVVRLAV
jgi:integrase